MIPDLLYVAAGACSSCPERSTCHEARQKVQDGRFAVGRHYGCEFYQAIQATRRASRPAAPRTPRRWFRWVLRGAR